ncbi:MAG: hypothetical protein JWO08_1657 [Verrucomicrobiaceae bacterium]|nr:hypothetical protein [Verrucomicrobiaceae bacterium]
MPVFKFIPFLAVMLALAPLPVVHGADTKSGKTKKEKGQATAKTQSAAKATDPSDAIDSMCKMIPEGRRNLKVHYPGFENGRPSSLIAAAAMTRVNPQEMFAEKLRIDLFGKEAKDNMRVDLKTGTYHLDTKMLVSDERSHVTRADFKVDGDSMEFDMTSSQGKMIGNVRMVIYDTSSFTSSTSEKTEQAKADDKTAAPATDNEPSPPPGK